MEETLPNRIAHENHLLCSDSVLYVVVFPCRILFQTEQEESNIEMKRDAKRERTGERRRQKGRGKKEKEREKRETNGKRHDQREERTEIVRILGEVCEFVCDQCVIPKSLFQSFENNRNSSLSLLIRTI